MTTLDERARAAAEAVHRAVAARPVPEPVTARPNRRPTLLAAGALAAAAAAVASLLAAGDGSDADRVVSRAGRPPSSTGVDATPPIPTAPGDVAVPPALTGTSRPAAPPSTDAAPEPAGWPGSAAFGRGWQQVQGPLVGMPEGVVHAAAVAGGRDGDAVIVAVGEVAGAPAAWVGTSRRWERVGRDTFGDRGALYGVAATRFGIVAVGNARHRPDGEPAAWRSTDGGRTWARTAIAPPEDEPFVDGGWLEDVTEGGPGLVAVGRVLDSSPPELLVEQGEEPAAFAAAWTSADGSTWGPPTFRRSLETGRAPTRFLSAVHRTPSELVAVGGDDVWRSPDGVTWGNGAEIMAEEEGPPESSTPSFREVTSVDDHVVVLGHRQREHERIAATWSFVPWIDGMFRLQQNERDDRGILRTGSITAVAGWEGGLVGMGDGDAVWVSPLGHSWRRVDLDPALFRDAAVSEVLATDDGLVAIGTVSLTPTIWVWSPPESSG